MTTSMSTSAAWGPGAGGRGPGVGGRGPGVGGRGSATPLYDSMLPFSVKGLPR